MCRVPRQGDAVSLDARPPDQRKRKDQCVAKRAKKKDASSNGGNGVVSVADLNKELFQAAITLRGSIEAPDYKRYVLPIIFLRFLSLRFERRREELKHMIADRNNNIVVHTDRERCSHSSTIAPVVEDHAEGGDDPHGVVDP